MTTKARSKKNRNPHQAEIEFGLKKTQFREHLNAIRRDMKFTPAMIHANIDCIAAWKLAFTAEQWQGFEDERSEWTRELAKHWEWKQHLPKPTDEEMVVEWSLAKEWEDSLAETQVWEDR